MARIPALRARSVAAALAAFATLGLAFPCLALAVEPPNFSTRLEYPEAFGPYAVELADIDGDGDLDVLSAIYDANHLSVRRNNGSGELGGAETYPVGWGVALATGDVSGDERPDVAIADFQGNRVLFLINSPGGLFVPGPILNFAGQNPRDLTLTDLDGDGDRDLAVACVATGTVHTYENSGGGAFIHPVVLSAGSAPKAIESADLDCDGMMDLVVNLYGSARVLVLRNRGDGSFASTRYVSGFHPSGLALGDLNADTRPDIATSNEDGTASVFLSQGETAYSAAASHPIGGLAQSLVLTDMNGDASLDLVAANYTNGTVSLWFNSGLGAFPAGQTVPVGPAPRGAVAADLDADDRADLVVGNYVYPSSTTSVLLNRPVPTPCTLRTFDAGPSPSQVAAADLDGDLDLDLAVVNEDGTLDVLLNQGGGQFGPPLAYSPIGGLAQSIVAADFDGDDRIDLAVSNFTESTVSVLMNRGGGLFRKPKDFAVGSHPRFVTSADLDLDGDFDLVTANYHDAIEPGSFTVLSNLGQGDFQAVLEEKTGIGPYMVSAADLGGDGLPDLGVNNYDANTVSVHRNLGGNAFAPPTVHKVGWGLWTAIGDFDGERGPDLAVANFQQHTLSILLNQGGGVFGPRTDVPTLVTPRSLGIVDADGDGNLDLAVLGSSSSLLRILRGGGDGTFSLLRTCATVPGPKTITVAPVDDQPGNEILICDYGLGSISLVDGGPELVATSPLRPVARHDDDASVLPARLELSAPRPNPVSGGTVTFVARLPAATDVDARIYDAAGRELRMLHAGVLPAGEHVHAWDGTTDQGGRARAGLYFLRLRAGTAVFQRKVILLARS
jgi:hypothetical protein